MLLRACGRRSLADTAWIFRYFLQEVRQLRVPGEIDLALQAREKMGTLLGEIGDFGSEAFRVQAETKSIDGLL